MKEYNDQQIVQAFAWLLTDWKPETKARFLRMCFSEYEPEDAGRLFARLAQGWEFDRDVTMNVALILIKEPAENAAKFIGSMSLGTDFFQSSTS